MAISGGHIAADRFAEYSAELREFSDTYRVPYGKPEDLERVLEAFRTSEGFATDFGSMIRSVVLREQYQASESELLTLVALAWGGTPKDDSKAQSLALLRELENILRDVVRRGTAGPNTIASEGSEEPPLVSLDVDDTIRELEQISPDVEMYRQLLKIQDRPSQTLQLESHHEAPSTQDSERFSTVEVRGESEQSSRALNSPVSRIPADEDGNIPPVLPFVHRSVSTGEGVSPPQESRAAEIIAMGLLGVVAALLVSVGSLPVYRAHVSVYLPLGVAVTTQNGSSSAETRLHPGSQDNLLGIGRLTDEVAERLLFLPHTNPIPRQDAISRGMRDFGLGQSQTILYADLVGETAQHVKVRRLQSQNVYEITCDSWSAQFAATFCQDLIDALDEQPETTSLRAVDAAIGPGIQVYPHWYLQGIAGLTLGCLVGIWLFLVRNKSKTAREVGVI